MKFTKHSHSGGLDKVPNAQLDEVDAALAQCKVYPGLRAAPKIRKALLENLVKAGWSGEVTVTAGSAITISSSKNNIGLCLQTGNMSRMYADLMKLQKLFLDDSIKAGVILVPTANAAKAIGSNIANAVRLKKELDIFRKVIHMPIVLYAFE